MALSCCASCLTLDAAPKHVVTQFNTPDAYPVDRDALAAVFGSATLTAAEQAELVDDLYDTTTDRKHIGCCAADGCPTDTCKEN